MGNTKYLIQPRLIKVSNDGNNIPWDVNNNPVSQSGLAQDSMANPVDSPTYRVLNPTRCPLPNTELWALNSTPLDTNVNLTGLSALFSMKRDINFVTYNLATQMLNPVNSSAVAVNRSSVNPILTSWYAEIVVGSNNLGKAVKVIFTDFSGDKLGHIIIDIDATGTFTFRQYDEYTGFVMNMTYEILPDYYLLSQGAFGLSDSPENACIATLGQDDSIYTTNANLVMLIGDWLYTYRNGEIVPYIREGDEGDEFYYVSYELEGIRTWLKLQYGTGIPDVKGDLIVNRGTCGEGGGTVNCVSYMITPAGGQQYSIEYIDCQGNFASHSASTPTTVCTDGSGVNVTGGSPDVSEAGVCS